MRPGNRSTTILNPESAKAWYERANALLAAARHEDAVDDCALALREYPDDPNLLCLSARALITVQLFADARKQAARALEVAPGFPRAHETIGDAWLLEGAAGKSIEQYDLALQSDPINGQVKLKRARAVEAASEHGGAVKRRQKNQEFEAKLRRASELERAGNFNDAEDIYRDILRADPDHVEAIRLLAATAVRHRKFSDAEVFLKRAVELAPDFARAWADLTSLYCEQEKLDEALASGEKVVEIAPQVSESWLAFANACGRAGKNEDAISHYRKAISLRPGHPGAYSGLGHQLKTIGRQDEAIAAHRECIAANPRLAEPWWSLANMKTDVFDDADIDVMESLLESGHLNDAGTVQLANALGLACERRKEYDKAFEYLDRGNTQRRQIENYDPVETETITDQIVEVFDREFIDTNAGNGHDDPSAIFIVGLPRSGSTLIEQILASHSQVEGTHELSDLAWVVRSLAGKGAERQRYPKSLIDMPPDEWRAIGDQYLERTQKFRSNVPRFIDKNPNNFIYAGLLAFALPNAKIINARRHPMDSCFGTWKQLFAAGQPFSYDLVEVGEYYLQYQRLMDHWHTVLPGHVLDVQYEDVVTDLDTQVRRLLDYCGLPFEQDCIDFHKTERAVRTASSEQVRQPIYASSVHLWKRYGAHLDDLYEVLEPILPEEG